MILLVAVEPSVLPTDNSKELYSSATLIFCNGTAQSLHYTTHFSRYELKGQARGLHLASQKINLRPTHQLATNHRPKIHPSSVVIKFDHTKFHPHPTSSKGWDLDLTFRPSKQYLFRFGYSFVL